MGPADEQKRILQELDEFVGSDITFDELTEFIVDAAAAVRSQQSLTVEDALRETMQRYRSNSRGRFAQYGEDGPPSDPVRESMRE